MTDRPTVPDVLPLVNAVYRRNPLGCCLRILTDDGNVEKYHAAFCVDQARESGHTDCLQAAEMLAKMTRTQRLQVYRRHD